MRIHDAFIRKLAVYACLALAYASTNLRAQTIITTVAGGTADGVAATSVALNRPSEMAFDSAGNLYIVDSSNNVIRKVHAGITTTVAGNGDSGYSGDGGAATSATFSGPTGVAVDAAGNLYIADPNNDRIRKVDVNGIITTVAGIRLGYSGDGGPATSALLNNPGAVAVDAAGNLYIADSGNSRIRKVDTNGIITTVAGNGTAGFAGDGGAATSAQIRSPQAIAVDAAGNLYIADYRNNRVRKVSVGGIITTVAGNGGGGSPVDGGQATSTGLPDPIGVALDAAGNLYISTGYHVIRKVAVGGTITTVAGFPYIANDGSCYALSTVCFSGDGGLATGQNVRFYGNTGVVVDATGNLYIADSGNNRIRKVNTSGIITTAVGNGTQSNSGDGGLATKAQFYTPAGIALDGAGNLYVADYDNKVIRKIDAVGKISTVAGIEPRPSVTFTGGYSGDGGAATSAKLNEPSGVAADATGNLFIADTKNHRIRKVSASGTITTVVGTGTGGYLGDDGVATSAQLYNPTSVAVGAAGILYIADSSNRRIRKVNAAGTITTVAGNGTDGFSGDGGAATSAQLSSLSSVIVDVAGNLYITDGSRIRKIDTSGTITTVAGNGSSGYSGDGGPATSAALWAPRGLAVDVAGNIFIALKESFVVRKVDGNGTITTVAGNGRTFGFSGDGGPATSAQMIQPWGVAVDAAGYLYIADTGNRRIRKVLPAVIFKDGFNGQN